MKFNFCVSLHLNVSFSIILATLIAANHNFTFTYFLCSHYSHINILKPSNLLFFSYTLYL